MVVQRQHDPLNVVLLVQLQTKLLQDYMKLIYVDSSMTKQC